MSYIVLARKWRPRRFEDVAGQEHITTTLLNSIRAGRTAHAYLFVGPRGVGKTSTARIFATALNCPAAQGGEPCGECDVCREIGAGRSIDVIEIDGASNNSVEDIRTLRENVKIAPANLTFKVYIIDEVHMLSTAAFNAFLKTLEEPPDHVKFLMATTEAHKIPATVLSRCQRFDFRRLTSRQIFTKLKTIADAENIQVDEKALFALARGAEGSMRDAQSALDQLVSFTDTEITHADVQTMLGTVGQDVYTRLVHALTEGDSVVILKTIDDIIERGKDLALFLRELTIYFRNLLIARLGADAELIDLPEEELAAVKEISGLFEHHDLIRIVHDLSDLESRFRQLPSPRVSLEMLLLRIAQLGADVSIDNLISKLTTLEKRFRGNTAGRGPAGKKNAGTTQYVQESDVSEYLPEKESASDDPVQDGEESPESFGDAAGAEDDEGESQMDLWRQFADEVRVQRMSIYSFLNKGRFCGIRDGEVIICFDEASRYNKTHLEQKEVRMLLEEILKTVAGTPLRLKMIIESAPAAAASTQEPKQKVLRDDRAEATAGEAVRQVDEIRKNPVVQKTVELFKGKIVYVSG